MMNLSTDIKPRTDGKVVATIGGKAYVFVRDHNSGQLTCDVADAAHVARLLDTGNFYPSDPDDIQSGLDVVSAQDVVVSTETEAAHDDSATAASADIRTKAAKAAKKATS